MSVAKIIQIISTSDNSFDDAIKGGLAKASETIKNISGLKVSSMTMSVKENKITAYKVTLDVAFGVD